MQKDLGKKRTMKCSAIQYLWMKKSTSLSAELLVYHMQLLHEQPVFGQNLVWSGVFDRTKHTKTLVYETQEIRGPCTRSKDEDDDILDSKDHFSKISSLSPINGMGCIRTSTFSLILNL